MNDPNGMIQWRGRYHLFYQYNPNGAFHGTIHWGHAVSDDLVHWEHLPIALTPTPGGPDKDGCWSGCAVDNGGVPTLVYTGVSPEVQCIATGSDDLIRWEKYAGNPVIALPPDGLEMTGFRDPYVWHDGDMWQMVLGGGIKNQGGTVLLYQSKDLIRWNFVGPILIDDTEQTDRVWECPSFFPLGDKYVLLISLAPLVRAEYFIGTFDGRRFTPETSGKLDFGRYFYAPHAMLSQDGRRIVTGWIREGRSDTTVQAAGWAGAQAVPRVLSIRSDGRLGMNPVSELRTLRREHHSFANIDLTPAATEMPLAVQGNCLEIVAVFESGDADAFGIKVRCSPDGKEKTLIAYDRAAGHLAIYRERSSLHDDVYRYPQSGVFDLAADESLKLHIFLDRSVIEVFANDRACVTSRVYPSRSDSLGLKLFARGGRVRLKSLDIWKMRSIWGCE